MKQRLHNAIYMLAVLVVAGLLAWQSNRHTIEMDWTRGARHSLSETSVLVLKSLHGPIRVEAFARTDKVLRTRIRDLIGRYRRVYEDIDLEFVNPDLDPERARDLGISVDGELVISYGGRIENLDKLDEQSMTNLLNRLARNQQRIIGFLAGHGERDPRGQRNHDFGEFGQQLQLKGFSPETVNLAAGDLLDETDVLVVADPRVALLPEELEILRGYLETGGNMMLVIESGERADLSAIKSELGVRRLPGTIVDANTQLFGIKDPTFALVSHYDQDMAITRGLTTVSVFPRAAALEAASGDWTVSTILKTRDGVWTERGPLRGNVGFNPDQGEVKGPLSIGLSLTRPRTGETGDSGNQRVIVLGDADFLSNAYLGNGGNLDLGLRLFNWLSHDDSLIRIPAKTAPDVALNLSAAEQMVIGFGFIAALPLALGAMALIVWRRRRRRG